MLTRPGTGRAQDSWRPSGRTPTATWKLTQMATEWVTACPWQHPAMSVQGLSGSGQSGNTFNERRTVSTPQTKNCRNSYVALASRRLSQVVVCVAPCAAVRPTTCETCACVKVPAFRALRGHTALVAECTMGSGCSFGAAIADGEASDCGSCCGPGRHNLLHHPDCLRHTLLQSLRRHHTPRGALLTGE